MKSTVNDHEVCSYREIEHSRQQISWAGCFRQQQFQSIKLINETVLTVLCWDSAVGEGRNIQLNWSVVCYIQSFHRSPLPDRPHTWQWGSTMLSVVRLLLWLLSGFVNKVHIESKSFVCTCYWIELNLNQNPIINLVIKWNRFREKLILGLMQSHWSSDYFDLILLFIHL